MDVYWSVERCGWVPCTGPADPLVTSWPLVGQPEPVPVPDQRPTCPVPVEP